MPHAPFDLLLLRDGALTLLASLIGGFFIMRARIPRMSVGAHVTGVVNGVLLLVLGVIWPWLALGDGWSQAGRWLMAISLPGLWAALKFAAAIGAQRTAPIAGAGAENRAGRVTEAVALGGIAGTSLMLIAGVIILAVGLFRL